MNINFPGGRDFKGLRVTRQGRRIWKQAVQEIKDPRGRVHYWIGGGSTNWRGPDDSDFRAVADGYISVTPLHLDLT